MVGEAAVKVEGGLDQKLGGCPCSPICLKGAFLATELPVILGISEVPLNAFLKLGGAGA